MELFDVRGAFTGAVRSKPPAMATAEGALSFSTRWASSPVDLQAKPLRAIQEKEIRPCGGTRAVPINVRILAATYADLEVAGAGGMP